MSAYTKLEVASAIIDCFYWTPGAPSSSGESKENVGSARPARTVYKTMVVPPTKAMGKLSLEHGTSYP